MVIGFWVGEMAEMLCEPGFKLEMVEGGKNRGKFGKPGFRVGKIGEDFGDRVLILTLSYLT